MFPGRPNPERGYKKETTVPKTGTRVQKRNDGTKNRNGGTFAKTTLLQNRPFVSSRNCAIYIYIYIPKPNDVIMNVRSIVSLISLVRSLQDSVIVKTSTPDEIIT